MECGDPKVLKPYINPLDTNPWTPWCYNIHRWVAQTCAQSHICKVYEPGKLADYFTATCIQDTPTSAHCAKSCEEMGMETAK